MKAKPSRFRNRIVGHGEVDPTQLVANPLNFRRHGAKQKSALRGSLNELGWIEEVLVNRVTGNMLDGHARVEEAIASHQPTVPVTYVELTEEEERAALASLDPIAAMATQDDTVLTDLLEQVDAKDQELRAFLGSLVPDGESPADIEVKEIDIGEVKDRFWVSVRGPIARQLDVLEKIRASLEALGPEVEVEVGVTSGG